MLPLYHRSPPPAWCLRQPHLFTSFFIQVFLGILLFLPTGVLIPQGAAKVVAISSSFQSSTHLFINLSSSLIIVAFGAPTVWNDLPDEIHSSPSLKPTCTPKHTHLSLDHPLVPPAWCSPWCLTLLLSLDTEIWSTAFLVLLCLRVLLYGEIKSYKSQIRITIGTRDTYNGTLWF